MLVSFLKRTLVRRRQVRRLTRALRVIDPVDRQVYLLCARDGLPRAEVAVRLGISVTEVEQRLAAALLAIAADMAAMPPAPVARGDDER